MWVGVGVIVPGGGGGGGRRVNMGVNMCGCECVWVTRELGKRDMFRAVIICITNLFYISVYYYQFKCF